MGDKPADFSGYATKANLRCSDGRTILPDAFKDQDQMKVPLVWQHSHSEPGNVLGHAVLENRPDGVYCYGYFNDTEAGQGAKKLVQHEDINSLSIYANRLKEKIVQGTKQVIHGVIREVSLVLAGANPGALIDQIAVAHSDGSYEELEDEAVIFTGLPLEHSDDEAETEKEDDKIVTDTVEHAEEEKTVEDVFNTFSKEQKDVVYYMIGEALKGKSGDSESDEASHLDVDINEVYHSLNDEQKDVLHYMVGEAIEQAKTTESSDEDSDSDAKHSDEDSTEDSDNNNSAANDADEQEGKSMTHNVFEQDATNTIKTGTSLSHADAASIFKQARKMGSLKEAVEAYAEDHLEHGIDNIDTLFPDAKAITSTPDFISRRQAWVNEVMSGTRHTPFSRIKSLTANLTFEEARAKGYIKGNLKKEEFFPVSKRVTTPQTIYKKQKLDRDDVLDITDFDVVAWLKGEMRLMLEEEIARAVLIGDGRSPEDEDKINETNIRPIATDEDLFVTRLYSDFGPDSLEDAAVAFVDSIVLNRRHYRGSGNPTLFIGEGSLAQLLLIKDGFKRRVYATEAELATALRVSKIVSVEVMDEASNNVIGVIVNLQDYNIGSDKGGDVSLFDDFDIDYNQYKYLIETRISGALVKAKSAIALIRTAESSTLVNPTAPTWDEAAHSVTVPTITGLVYKNKMTGGTLTTASPVVLSEGEELHVVAQPESGYHLASNTADEWLFDYEQGQVDGIF